MFVDFLVLFGYLRGLFEFWFQRDVFFFLGVVGGDIDKIWEKEGRKLFGRVFGGFLFQGILFGVLIYFCKGGSRCVGRVYI